MVADTATYDLPYQQGGDRPCDAPEVWCALTELEDAALSSIKEIRDRVFPAVPAAIVTTTPLAYPIATQAASPQPIAGVEADTDGMVDVSVSLYRIRPRRPGIYAVSGFLQMTGLNGAGGQIFQLAITTGFYGPGPVTGTTSGSTSGQDDVYQSNAGGLNYPAVSTMVQTSDPLATFPSDSYGMGVAVVLTPTEVGTSSNGRLSAYWLRDHI